jgi:Arc/MetJ-type ribon-helix-helix transcriptional regulator
MLSRMAIQIAVRIPDRDVAAMDKAIRAGRYESRAAAVREALGRLLADEREKEIAEQYRRAYSEVPEEDWIGEMGRTLMAESVNRLERRDQDDA